MTATPADAGSPGAGAETCATPGCGHTLGQHYWPRHGGGECKTDDGCTKYQSAVPSPEDTVEPCDCPPEQRPDYFCPIHEAKLLATSPAVRVGDPCPVCGHAIDAVHKTPSMEHGPCGFTDGGASCVFGPMHQAAYHHLTDGRNVPATPPAVRTGEDDGIWQADALAPALSASISPIEGHDAGGAAWGVVQQLNAAGYRITARPLVSGTDRLIHLGQAGALAMLAEELEREGEPRAALLADRTAKSYRTWADDPASAPPEVEPLPELVSGTANRDDVARWLWRRDGFTDAQWDAGTPGSRGHWLTEADELLAMLGGDQAITDWQPGRWWRVAAPDGTTWCLTSDEAEARAAVRPGDLLTREHTRSSVSHQWREVQP